MPRRQAQRTTSTSEETERIPTPTFNDEILQRLASIEEEVNRHFEEIDQELDRLKTQSKDDGRFLKLCHAVDYLLERNGHDYETIACREMLLSLLDQKLARPFSGRTIRNRELCRRMKRWCLFIALILFIVACMSIYGWHRNWCYLLVILCLSGSIISSIGLRRLYKIIEAVW